MTVMAEMVPYCVPLTRQGLDPLDRQFERLYVTKICPQCPLQADCLTLGRRVDRAFGVWGGQVMQEAAA